MLVAFHRRTGAVIPDFQSKATAEGLIDNAVKAGIAKTDVEVREVTEEQAKELADAVFASARAAAEQEQVDRAAAVDALMKRLGLTADDIPALRDLISG